MVNADATRRLDFHRGNAGCDRARAIAAFILAGLLAGCAAGPDFQRPAPPEVEGYTAAPMPARTASAPTALGGAQHFNKGASVDAQWWHALGSPTLNQLIEEAFRSSPTLSAAKATLRQAQEIHSAQTGSTLYPRVDAGMGAQRQRLNPSAFGQAGSAKEFSLYNANLGVHYQLDLSGGNRRSLESLAARAEHRRHELEGARLTLAANIATAAISQARLAGQVQSTEALLRAQDEQLHLTRERVRIGQAAPADVLPLQAQVEESRAGLPALRKQLQQNQHLLAVLTGRTPGSAQVPVFTLEDFTLPSELPVVLPSELVRRRPDIQAAESLMHAANAEYGVAVAKMYPQLNLSANLGSQALSAGALFGSGSAVWSLVAQLTQPLFDRGLPAQKRASLAAFDAAAANYQSVVLESLREVADILRAVENDAEALTSLAKADAAAQGSLESAQKRYALGAASYLELLLAQEKLQQTRIKLISAQAQRLVDSAALYQAMGGAVA